jgi:hypothetical protein
MLLALNYLLKNRGHKLITWSERGYYLRYNAM